MGKEIWAAYLGQERQLCRSREKSMLLGCWCNLVKKTQYSVWYSQNLLTMVLCDPVQNRAARLTDIGQEGCTGWTITSRTWVRLTLIWLSHPSCLAVPPILPNSHLPEQYQKSQKQIDPTQVREVMAHPVGPGGQGIYETGPVFSCLPPKTKVRPRKIYNLFVIPFARWQFVLYPS